MQSYYLYILAVPLIALMIYWRARRSVGRQPVKPNALRTRLIFSFVVCALLIVSGFHRAPLIEGLFAGIVVGSVVGLLGLHLARMHPDDQFLHYSPNAWIGGSLIALLIGRIAYKFFEWHSAMAASNANADAIASMGRTPLTQSLLGLLLGYYLIFNAGLLIRWRQYRQNLSKGS
ncbi:DUF1453 domain-containing protein [Dyella monticola]|uniref:DUF1453 domain-containing protein n=1 Tax=Dyella monticola TaxID=1927958 RepID=UPI000E1D984A|nr:DUF1453 domain-containing protein [Dyella monticola]